MTPRNLAIGGMTLVFLAGIVFALTRELDREEETLQGSISGIAAVAQELWQSGQADIVRTDRLVLILIDPNTMEPAAWKFISPLVPPQNYRIGQQDSSGGQLLRGEYLLVGITDKDGEIFKITPGEVYGRTALPIALGAQEVPLVMDQPFRGSLLNGPLSKKTSAASAGLPGNGETPDPAFSIQGTISAAPELAGQVKPSDRLIILLFDPEQGRPVAFNIVPQARFPQKFIIGLPAPLRENAKPGYQLRVITDRDQQPLSAVPGEIVGRSRELLPLGTKNLEFVLDQPFTR